jgi:isoquinoline 1-oxidoreductase alpha subunit
MTKTTALFAGGANMKFRLKVNGQVRELEGPDDLPLLWALRDGLDLKGTKFGCGIAECGACTVLIDGVARRSCVTPASSVGKSAITTIEGLSRDGAHPLQRAWEELDVPQCGYCQAGQLMSAAALLAERPNPTDAQIDEAMAGNLCRCATYLRIRRAIHRAAELSKTASAGATGSGR